MYLTRIVCLLLPALLLAGCGGQGPGTGSGNPGPVGECGATAQKQYVLAQAREWYLFPELLPASVDPAAFATATELLDALTATARAQGRDRFFSFITSINAEQQVLAAGESAGFGVSLLTLSGPARVVLSQVFAASAAADAGLERGDTLLAIGTSAATLEPIETILARPNGLSEALGPSTAGVVRVLRWRTVAGLTPEASITKRSFSLDPVPANGIRLIQRPGLAPVGHVTLRSFISPADNALRAAFETFRVNNVRDVIIDLRYNGGGLVSTAELLLNLLAGTRTNEVSYALRLSPAKRGDQRENPVLLTPLAQSLPTLQIALITTAQSASASELVINSLTPYARVAIVGSRSFGKPVGQFAFDIAACDLRLRLVTFKTVNRNGDGDYFNGLPDAAFGNSGGFACAAADDFTRLPGNAAEGMTAEALSWINSGVCTAAPVAGRPDAIAGAETQNLKSAIETATARSALHQYMPGTY